MAGFDEGEVFRAYQGLEDDGRAGQDHVNQDKLIKACSDFIRMEQPVQGSSRKEGYHYR